MRSNIKVISLPYPARPAIACLGLVPLLGAWLVSLAGRSDGVTEFVEAEGWATTLYTLPDFYDSLRTGHDAPVLFTVDYDLFIMDAAAANAGGHDNAPLPLDSFTKSTPPGWVTGIKRCPIRRYAQLLKL